MTSSISSPNAVGECGARGVRRVREERIFTDSSRRASAPVKQQHPPAPQSLPSSFSYVLLQLQRPNCTIPWGLSLSLFEERYLVVGDVNEKHAQYHQMVQSSWSTRSCPVHPSLFWNNMTTAIARGQCHGGGSSSSSSSSCLSPNQVASFVQYLVASFPPDCPQEMARRGMILPGDCILAVNGTTVAGNFRTLSQATSALQSQTHLFLIILRLQSQPQQRASSLPGHAGHNHGQHLLHHPAAAATRSPTSTLRFPMPQQQQQQQQQQQESAESSTIFQTARRAWRALRLLNHHHHHHDNVIVVVDPPPSTPLPPPPAYSSSSCDDSSWSAADALLCLLRGNNNNFVASSAVKPAQPLQQNQRGNNSTSSVAAFYSTSALNYYFPSMATTPLAIWSSPAPPPRCSVTTTTTTTSSLDRLVPSSFSSCPPPLVSGNIYSYYSPTCVLPSPPPTPPPPQTVHRHHHWPSERRDFQQQPVLYYNPLFRDRDNKNQVPARNVRGSPTRDCLLLPYDDDWEEEEPDEGQRARLFLKPISTSIPATFDRWLLQRKGTWRRQRRYSSARNNTRFRPSPAVAALADWRTCSTTKLTEQQQQGGFVLYRNPLFCENPKNESKSTSTAVATSAFFGPTSGLPYDDDLEFEPDDGQRAALFLRPIDTSSPDSFGCWLKQRKRKWRQTSYQVYRLETNNLVEDDDNKSSLSSSKSSILSILDEDDLAATARIELSVAVDFWSSQGHSSFQHWLSASKSRWKSSYSWNQRKRQRIQEDCDQVVRLLTSPLHHRHHRRGDDNESINDNNSNNDNFAQWLRVRKNQWRVLRRKRQRERIKEQSKHQRDQPEHGLLTSQSWSVCSDGKKITDTWDTSSPTSVKDLCQQLHQPSFQSDELIAIDALLEDQERERRAKETRNPLDISLLFDSSLNCPDDVVVHCFQYLDPMEHCKLLCLNHETRQALSKREDVWRQLCPTTWQLPRRPRKPWYVLYLTKLRTETERARKRCDDVLVRAASILLKGDQLQSIEKLCAKAEQDVAMPFDVNYSSGVVCERNSLLNLAVIHQRHKVVRWLVETMKADIESYDRGGFTPLLNAAWAGDKYLVRYFLSAGANRSHIGTCHYTKPLAAPDFAGLNAAGWARKQGHDGIAKLIELGL